MAQANFAGMEEQVLDRTSSRTPIPTKCTTVHSDTERAHGSALRYRRLHGSGQFMAHFGAVGIRPGAVRQVDAIR
jgi:hypothetical protein